MDDLINRQAVLKKMCEMCYYHTSQDFVCSKCNVYELLAEQPAVEAEPVRHGRWVEQDSPYGGHFNCSECGYEVTVPHSELIDPRDYVCYLDDYCGKCGARMDATDTNVDDKGGVDNDT